MGHQAPLAIATRRSAAWTSRSRCLTSLRLASASATSASSLVAGRGRRGDLQRVAQRQLDRLARQEAEGLPRDHHVVARLLQVRLVLGELGVDEEHLGLARQPDVPPRGDLLHPLPFDLHRVLEDLHGALALEHQVEGDGDVGVELPGLVLEGEARRLDVPVGVGEGIALPEAAEDQLLQPDVRLALPVGDRLRGAAFLDDARRDVVLGVVVRFARDLGKHPRERARAEKLGLEQVLPGQADPLVLRDRAAEAVIERREAALARAGERGFRSRGSGCRRRRPRRRPRAGCPRGCRPRVGCRRDGCVRPGGRRDRRAAPEGRAPASPATRERACILFMIAFTRRFL